MLHNPLQSFKPDNPNTFPMDAQKQVSIIVPTYNRYPQLVRTVDLLVRQILTYELTDSVEVLIVDDGSAAEIATRVRDYIVRQNHCFLRYLVLPENRGASAARNTGAQASQGALLAFLDDDIVPADDYIRAIIRVHQQHPEALVINGNLRPLHDDLYSGFWFHYYDAIFNRPGEQFYAIEMLSSGHFSMKRTLRDIENPLFDTFLTAREDYDLYLRLEKRGIPVYKDDSIVAFNDCRDTLCGFLKQRLWYGGGQEQLVAKHGAALIADKQKSCVVPPKKKYLHLYILLRLARRTFKLYTAVRQLFERIRG
jgi:glycosyltransferase involved in cell wall biosynthesis